MEKESRIYIVGSDTLVGAALVGQLRQNGYGNVLTESYGADLIKPAEVDWLFETIRPEYVVVTGGKSGGILANQLFSADLMLHNLQIDINVISRALSFRVNKLLYLASSCAYPRDCPQPMKVAAFFSGPLDPTHEAYGLAKIVGIKLCQAIRRQFQADFIAALHANAFGPGDDFDSTSHHVIPALIRKIHEAKIAGSSSVEIWGSGNARREFIFAGDVADACIFLLLNYSDQLPVNIGTGTTFSIRELASLISRAVGYRGQFCYDTVKPDGVPIKSLDSTQIFSLGWEPKTSIRDGIAATYSWWLLRSIAMEGSAESWIA